MPPRPRRLMQGYADIQDMLDSADIGSLPMGEREEDTMVIDAPAYTSIPYEVIVGEEEESLNEDGEEAIHSSVDADFISSFYPEDTAIDGALTASHLLRNTDPYELLGETLFGRHVSPSVSSFEEQSDDDNFDDTDMFEYANTGMNIQYTDTDIDLERSLDMRELLDSENVGADALLCYRSEKFEDQKIITENDVRKGMDMQGIRWKKGAADARKEYRFYRVSTYENYFNSDGPYRGPVSPCTHDGTDRSFLRFIQMQTEYKCTLVHFQLRNLLTALDRNSIYHTEAAAVKVYRPHDHSCRTVMDLSKMSVTYPFKISSLALTPDFCCTGGFFGEYAIKSLRSENFDSDPTSNVHVGLITSDTSGITNHISPQISRSGVSQMFVSSNDSCLRALDVETLKLTSEMYLDHPLNCSATSRDKRLTLAVGDHCSSILLDAENGEILRKFDGHTDYSFACAWSSDGHTFATGSQDLTTRLYDARHTDQPIAIFKASIGAVRSLKFSECGKFLAIAEPADFVHVHDLHDLGKTQSIDFFGEISGIDFAGDSFFVGNADKVIGGIAEYELRRDNLDLENLLL